MSTAPRRIVSLVPSTTESVCAFGAADRLVACTRYCEAPAEVVARLPRVGGTKNPQLDAIARLAPDLVLGNAEENRPEDLAWLAARMPVLVQTPCTIGEARAALLQLGERLQAPAPAAACAAELDAAVAHGASLDARHQRLRGVYVIWRKPWMAAGRGTYLASVLEHCGVDLVGLRGGDRYPAVEPADCIADEAQLVLLPSEPWAFTPADAVQIAAAATFGSAQVAFCDGRDFCWHGVRAALGVRRAAESVRRFRPPRPA